MSRTVKDQPLWVRAEWWKPWHYCDVHRSQRWGAVECDLPPEPVVRRTLFWLWEPTTCFWMPDDSRLRNLNTPTPPKGFRDHVWTNKQRRLVRDQLRRAAQDWNGSGDTDVEPSVAQHRHCAGWLYW